MAYDLARVRIIFHGFGIQRAFRRTLPRTDYASGLMAAKKLPNRLQKLGGEDQLELAKVHRLRLARLGFEKLTIRDQLQFA